MKCEFKVYLYLRITSIKIIRNGCSCVRMSIYFGDVCFSARLCYAPGWSTGVLFGATWLGGRGNAEKFCLPGNLANQFCLIRHCAFSNSNAHREEGLCHIVFVSSGRQAVSESASRGRLTTLCHLCHSAVSQRTRRPTPSHFYSLPVLLPTCVDRFWQLDLHPIKSSGHKQS